jgi:hypothetical protein
MLNEARQSDVLRYARSGRAGVPCVGVTEAAAILFRESGCKLESLDARRWFGGVNAV